MQLKSFAIWANADKKQVPELVSKTVEWAEKNSLKVHLPVKLKSEFNSENVSFYESNEPPLVDFLLCFGGDGTLIAGVRIFNNHNVPILGVHLGGLLSLIHI